MIEGRRRLPRLRRGQGPPRRPRRPARPGRDRLVVDDGLLAPANVNPRWVGRWRVEPRGGSDVPREPGSAARVIARRVCLHIGGKLGARRHLARFDVHIEHQLGPDLRLPTQLQLTFGGAAGPARSRRGAGPRGCRPRGRARPRRSGRAGPAGRQARCRSSARRALPAVCPIVNFEIVVDQAGQRLEDEEPDHRPDDRGHLPADQRPDADAEHRAQQDASRPPPAGAQVVAAGRGRARAGRRAAAGRSRTRRPS